MAEVNFYFLLLHSFLSKVKEFDKKKFPGIECKLETITEWLDSFNLNYKVIEDIITNKVVYIPLFIVNLERFFTADYLQYLPSSVLHQLKDENSNVYLIFFTIWESTGMQEYRNGIPRKILELTKKYGIRQEKVLWVSNDLNIRHNVDLFNMFSNGLLSDNPNSNFYLDEEILNRKKFFGLDMFESRPWTKEMLKMPILSNEFLKEENKNIKSKYALSKTGKVRGNRLMIANYLLNSKNFDKTFFSWIDVYRHNIPNIDEISLRYIFKLYYPDMDQTDPKVKKFLDNIRYLDKNKPWVLDIDPNAKKNFKHIGFQSNINRKFLSESYTTIVTETDYEEKNLGKFFITEKTYQQFAFYHPFILVGVQGLYSYIKSNGYETFPELFDESFDDILDPVKRFNKTLQSLDDFFKTPKQKLTDIVSSDYFVDKLIHNRKNLETRVHNKNTIEFKKWLFNRGNI